jgi:cell division protein FtsW
MTPKTHTRRKTGRSISDLPLLFIVFALLGIGLLMVASAGVATGNFRFEDGAFFFKRQLVGVAVGLVALYVFRLIPYRFWRTTAVPVFFISAGLLVLVLIPGVGKTAS